MKSINFQFAPERKVNTAWWMNPAWFLLFITLPAFILSSMYASEVADANQIGNFVSPYIVFVGALSIITIAIGVGIGKLLLAGTRPNSRYDERRFLRVAYWLTIASIISHVILIGKILANYELVLAALSGSKGAIYQVKNNMVKITGVTSFTQLYLIALPLFAAYPSLFGKQPPKRLTLLSIGLAGLVLTRAFVTLERFSLVEATLAYALVYLSYRPRRARLVGYYPLIGFVLIYFLFAAGEYTRSWPYYQDQYDSFWSFVNIRLLGYITTAINNAAGVLETSGSVYTPYYTAAWLHKLPLWNFFDSPFSVDSPLQRFFALYASEEFNNPGGVLAGVMDYGLMLSVFYNALIGTISGVLFYQFRKRGAFALVYFPGWYLGFPLLTQTTFWGDPRFFTVTVLAPFVANYITKPKPSL